MSYEGIDDVEVLTEDRSFAGPNIIIDVDTARRAIEEGALHDMILDAIRALELSGQNIVVIRASE